MNEGVLWGAFKGVTFNLTQLGLVLYPSVYFANKNGNENKFLTFLSTYTLLDALFYPVDTLKSILYADTLGKYSIKTVAIDSSHLISTEDFLSSCCTICQFYRASTAPPRLDTKPKPLPLGPSPFSFTPSTPKK